jgi:hypothetical protein
LWYWNLLDGEGDLVSLEYVVSGTTTPLAILYDPVWRALVVTVGTDVVGDPISTAAQIKALVKATAYLSDRFVCEYSTGQDGSGVVGTFAHTHFAYP